MKAIGLETCTRKNTSFGAGGRGHGARGIAGTDSETAARRCDGLDGIDARGRARKARW